MKHLVLLVLSVIISSSQGDHQDAFKGYNQRYYQQGRQEQAQESQIHQSDFQPYGNFEESQYEGQSEEQGQNHGHEAYYGQEDQGFEGYKQAENSGFEGYGNGGYEQQAQNPDHKHSASHLIDQTYEVAKPVRIPVYKHRTVPIPYAVPVPVPKPVVVPVAQPYPVQILVPHAVPIPVIKTINFQVEKQVPVPVIKEVQFKYEKPVPVHVDVPRKYPVYVPVYKHIYLPSKEKKQPQKIHMTKTTGGWA